MTLAGSVADARLMERAMRALGLMDDDLEDRRGWRPNAFRVQCLMYLMREGGMSIRRVSLLVDRDRSCVRNAERIVGATLAVNPRALDYVHSKVKREAAA